MKDEIFRLLKQAYSPLGLGDAFLMARAEMLDSLGFVTSENVGDIVAKQKSSLEAAQKSHDSRVTEALKKAEEEAKKKAAEEAKKKAEEDAKKAAEEAARKAEEERRKAEEEAGKDLSPALKKFLEEMEKKHADEMKAQKDAYDATIKTLNDSVASLQKTNQDAEAARAKAERQTKILNKAKELGIPQSRIDEGFVIADDMDDAAIGTYLGNVKKNIDASKLPAGNHFSLSEGEPSKEDVDAVASSLLGM